MRDSGVLHHLLGIREMLELRTHPRYGASWEGFALEQTLIAHGERDAYFYGTQRGAELDLLLLRRGRRWGFEFKCSDAPKTTKSMIKGFWEKDGKLDGTFGPVGTVEAAGYLIPLLDPKKDAEEIADLKAKVKRIEALPRAITPIAVALHSGAALDDIVASDAAVSFDADASGRNDAWTWITPRAAWLVYDHAGEGQVDSAIQFFGNRTFMLFLEDGYAGLRLLDEDGDGQLRGGELESLALWHDTNSNGISDPGEVRTLDHYAIESIEARPVTHATGILHNPAGVRYSDGRTTATFDVLLERK